MTAAPATIWVECVRDFPYGRHIRPGERIELEADQARLFEQLGFVVIKSMTVRFGDRLIRQDCVLGHVRHMELH